MAAPMPSASPVDHGWVARLDALLEALAEHPDEAVRATFGELFEGIRRLHAEGLARLVELLAEDQGRFTRALDEPAVANLLLLYDLVTIDEQQRAREAIASVRPLIESRGGQAELLQVEEGLVHLRLAGSGDAWAVSTEMVMQALDTAFAARLPGYRGMEIDSPDVRRSGGGWAVDASGSGDWVSFVPVENLRRMEKRIANSAQPAPASGLPRPSGGNGIGSASSRVAVAALGDLHADQLHGRIVENTPVLLLRLGERVAGYRNVCPGSLLPLHLGELHGGVIHCPWHGCRFDAESGEPMGEGRGALEPFRTTIAEAQVWLEL